MIRKDKTDEKQLYLEQWDADGFISSLKLPDCGKVYNNGVFGGISWSRASDKVVFVAERKPVSIYYSFLGCQLQALLGL